jgi:hypothetical protein
MAPSKQVHIALRHVQTSTVAVRNVGRQTTGAERLGRPPPGTVDDSRRSLPVGCSNCVVTTS